jgi:hypothetical protein
MSIFMAEVHFDEVVEQHYQTRDDEIDGETFHLRLRYLVGM